MPVKKLKQYLDDNQIKYVCISHSPAYTAQTIAESAHIPGKELAKTVIVKLDGKCAMAVLPASSRVKLERLRAATSADQVELASEEDFKNLFPDCELGAMPPFGNLYSMKVYASPLLKEDEEIAFSAGSHTELVQMSFSDFERLVAPRFVALD